MTRPTLVADAGEAGSSRGGRSGQTAPSADPASPAAGVALSMSDTFYRPASPVKCQLPEDRHSRKRPFARAMATATWGRCEQIASRTHRSGRLVRAWENPEDPNLPPNQVLADVMDAAIATGATEDEALAPLAHLADRYGRTLGYLDGAGSPEAEALHRSAASLIESSARTAVACVEALADGSVSGPELRAIEETGHQLINAVHLAIRRAQAAHGRTGSR